MPALLLLVGFLWSSVALALGYTVLPPLLLLTTVATVWLSQRWDERSRRRG